MAQFPHIKTYEVHSHFEFMCTAITGIHNRNMHRPQIESPGQSSRAMLVEHEIVVSMTHYTISSL